jgi:hypothetical protein
MAAPIEFIRQPRPIVLAKIAKACEIFGIQQMLLSMITCSFQKPLKKQVVLESLYTQDDVL